MFLATTEQAPRGTDIPTRVNPDLFEKLLPYALALNVEKVWGEKFAATLAQTAKRGMMDFSPHWYSGPGWNPITASNFATSLGSSFASAISSSTTHSAFDLGTQRFIQRQGCLTERLDGPERSLPARRPLRGLGTAENQAGPVSVLWVRFIARSPWR